MKGKMGLLTNFNFFKSQRWKYCQKKFKVYGIFLSWKLLKLSPQTRVKVLFSERYAFSAHKALLLTASLIEKYLKKVFVLSRLSSNEKNSSDYHNSYNKGPNLAFFSFRENPSNSLPTIKFPKNHITSSYHSNMPKTAKAKIWPLRTLGVNTFNKRLCSKLDGLFLICSNLDLFWEI
jgi:hypothetical protein